MININIFLNSDAPISASMIYHRQVPSTAVDVKYRFQSKGLKEHLFRDTTLEHIWLAQIQPNMIFDARV